MEGHAVHDDARYVPPQKLSACAERSPVHRYKVWLADNTDFSEADDDHLRAEVKALLEEAVRKAEASPLPDAASVSDGVYA